MTGDALLAVEVLKKHYAPRDGIFQRRGNTVRAVDGISFAIDRSESVGLVGESGCGKSTAVETVVGLTEPTDGTVRFDGSDVEAFSAEERRTFRRRVSIVFQNPSSSFDPKLSVGESVAEPLRVQGVEDAGLRQAVVRDLLSRCGLSPAIGDRYPHELSDGQKQRAALARALVLDPDLLVADEPVSALDMSVQAEILTLLNELRADLDIAMLVISHDMDVIAELCDRVCVMYLGEIVERGPTDRVLAVPKHPYTTALVGSVATPDPRASGDREPLGGDIPDPASPPAGCRFHPRCPEIIPPNDVDVDPETYRGIVDLRAELAADDLDEETLRGLADVPSGGNGAVTDSERVLERGLRQAHDLPDELSNPTAEAAVNQAITAAVNGEAPTGARHLRDAFESICERSHPAPRPVEDDQQVACHLFPATEGDGAHSDDSIPPNESP